MITAVIIKNHFGHHPINFWVVTILITAVSIIFISISRDLTNKMRQSIPLKIKTCLAFLVLFIAVVFYFFIVFLMKNFLIK
jgi:hypothetical protein